MGRRCIAVSYMTVQLPLDPVFPDTPRAFDLHNADTRLWRTTSFGHIQSYELAISVQFASVWYRMRLWQSLRSSTRWTRLS